MVIKRRQIVDRLSLILTQNLAFARVKMDFCTKKALSNAAVYGIVVLSAGDDDWVPCGAML